MTPLHKQVSILIIASLIVVSLAAGCGGGGSADSGVTAPSSGSGGSAPAASSPGKGGGQQEAEKAALHHMQDANSGSTFKASKTCLCDNWARVNVQETGVPDDEAVACIIYLRQKPDGTWEVMDSGPDVTSDDLPEAPEDLFE